MAARVPLPKRDALPEMVLFHRDHPQEPSVILQVPNADRTEAATYVIRMDRETDVHWLENLPNARELRAALEIEQHIAYCARTGHLQAVEDLDAPTRAEIAFWYARHFGAPSDADRFFQQRARRVPPAPSTLRLMLGGRWLPGIPGLPGQPSIGGAR